MDAKKKKKGFGWLVFCLLYRLLFSSFVELICHNYTLARMLLKLPRVLTFITLFQRHSTKTTLIKNGLRGVMFLKIEAHLSNVQMYRGKIQVTLRGKSF